MPDTKVTDPALLAELDKPVSDPALLAQLEGGEHEKPAEATNRAFPGFSRQATASLNAPDAPPSAAAAFAKHAGNALQMGLGGPISGARAALAGVLKRSGVPIDYKDFGSPAADYEAGSGAERYAQGRAAESHPAAALAGSVAGSLPFSGLPAPAVGAIAGLGSEEPAKGAVAGAAGGAALQAAGNAASPYLAKGAAALRDLLDQARVAFGRKVLYAGAQRLGTAYKPVADEVVREGFHPEVQAFRPFGTSAGAADRFNDARQLTYDTKYVPTVNAFKAADFGGPERGPLVDSLRTSARAATANGNPDVAGAFDNQADIVSRMALKNEWPNTAFPPPSPNPETRLGIDNTLNGIRAAQDKAYYNRLNLAETFSNRARKAAASDMRQSLEDALDQQATASNNPMLQRAAAEFPPIKQELGRRIEGSDVLERALSQKAQRSGTFGKAADRAIGSVVGAAVGHPGIGAAAGQAVGAMERNRFPSTMAWLMDKLHGGAEPVADPKVARALLGALARGGAVEAGE